MYQFRSRRLMHIAKRALLRNPPGPVSAADSHLWRGFEGRDLRPAEKVLLAYLHILIEGL